MLINFKNELNFAKYERASYFTDQLFLERVIDSDNTDSDLITEKIDQDSILTNINNLQDKKKYLESVKNLVQMLMEDAEQTMTFFKEDHLFYLFNGLQYPKTTLGSLTILYLLVHNNDHLRNFYSLILKYESVFFSVINDIFNYSIYEYMHDAAIIFLQCLSRLIEFPPLLIKHNILPSINKLANKSVELDYCISRFYYILSLIEFKEPLVFFEEVFPLIHEFCQHEDPGILSFSLMSLHSLMSQSPLPFNEIISNSMIELFINNLNRSDFPEDYIDEIQNHSLSIIVKCVQYQDFPFDSTLMINIIECVFNALQSNEELASLCINLLDSIFQNCDKDIIHDVVVCCSNYNFLNMFSSQLLKTKIKAIDIFDFLIKQLDPEDVLSFCNDESIEFILNLMISSYGDFPITQNIIQVLNNLLSIFHDNEDFIESFLSVANELGSFDLLVQILDDSKMPSECNDVIADFLNNIDLLQKEFDSTE